MSAVSPAVPDARTVQMAMHRLLATTASQNRHAVKRRIDEFVDRAAQSPYTIDAAFAAVQTARDFGTIDRAEAAWLFRALFELTTRVACASTPAESEAGFYRARGEAALAEFVERRPRAHTELCSAGRRSLIVERRRGTQLVATLPEPMEAVSAPGGLSDHESARYVDSFLFGTFCRAWDADGEVTRLRRAMNAIKRAHGLQADAPFPGGQQPFDWKVLAAQLDRRMNGIAAFWLRQHGEHRLASLLVERPEEYERLVAGGSFHWRRCA